MKFLQFFIILVYYNGAEAKYHNNVFKEELVIRELRDSFVNTYFQFTTQWNFKTNENERKKSKIDYYFSILLFS